MVTSKSNVAPIYMYSKNRTQLRVWCEGSNYLLCAHISCFYPLAQSHDNVHCTSRSSCKYVHLAECLCHSQTVICLKTQQISNPTSERHSHQKRQTQRTLNWIPISSHISTIIAFVNVVFCSSIDRCPIVCFVSRLCCAVLLNIYIYF